MDHTEHLPMDDEVISITSVTSNEEKRHNKSVIVKNEETMRNDEIMITDEIMNNIVVNNETLTDDEMNQIDDDANHTTVTNNNEDINIDNTTNKEESSLQTLVTDEEIEEIEIDEIVENNNEINNEKNNQKTHPQSSSSSNDRNIKSSSPGKKRSINSPSPIYNLLSPPPLGSPNIEDTINTFSLISSTSIEGISYYI